MILGFQSRFVESKFPYFWKHVVKTEGCWIWTGSRNTKKYGRCWDGYGSLYSHRASWIMENGPIPEGLLVLHKCDNPSCVNPSHLFLGTELDNARDRESKGRGRQPSGDRNGSRTHPECLKRGSQSPMSKLEESQVIEIRKSVAERRCFGFTVELAKKYSVSPALISHIVNRRAWKHLL